MTSDPEWRASLSFSDRFANISNLYALNPSDLPRWKSSKVWRLFEISVTQRYLSVTGLINLLDSVASLESRPDISSADARQQAKALEKEIYNDASSLEEYNVNCAGAAESSVVNQPPEQFVEDEEEEAEDLSSIEADIGSYTQVRHFRDGLFSSVYRAREPSDGGVDSSGEVVALKVTTPSMMENPHDSEREARILNAIAHPRIVPLLDVFKQAGGRLVLVFPFLPYDLHGLMQAKMVTRKRVKSHLHDMFEALKFIHSLGYIHRDIKPSNLLLRTTSGPAYLADFGIAWSPIDPASEFLEQKITDVGTTCYRPPELLFGNKEYGCSLDLWAAGCTVAEADSLDGQTLFDSGDLGSELALIQSIFMSLGTPTLEMWPEASEFPDWGKMAFREYSPKTWIELLPTATQSARELVQELVKFQSDQRLVASEALNHQYFASAS